MQDELHMHKMQQYEEHHQKWRKDDEWMEHRCQRQGQELLREV
jgi:hypothetical protein